MFYFKPPWGELLPSKLIRTNIEHIHQLVYGAQSLQLWDSPSLASEIIRACLKFALCNDTSRLHTLRVVRACHAFAIFLSRVLSQNWNIPSLVTSDCTRRGRTCWFSWVLPKSLSGRDCALAEKHHCAEMRKFEINYTRKDWSPSWSIISSYRHLANLLQMVCYCVCCQQSSNRSEM